MSITAAFADHLAGRFAQGLDDESTRRAIELVTDGIAVAVAGAGEPGPTILRQLAAATGAQPAATAIGAGSRVGVVEAARANGAAMHVLDWEPMWNPANHHLSTTLPAVLALAEAIARGRSPLAGAVAPIALTGRRILTALAVGIEAQARMRRASGQLDPGQLKFHPPGAVGAFGSAAACGLLIGLDRPAFVNALAIAASRASGVQANIGSMTKALHCGGAAAAGLESVLMAAHGFTGDADAIGDPRGYGRAFYGATFDPAPLTAEADRWHIVDPGPAWKLFPSQYATHFAITAALEARDELQRRGLDTSAIRRVRLVTPEMPYVDRPWPTSGLAGKFSFQYTAAAALLDGRVTVASFKDERRFAPDMEALLPRIRVVPDESREGRFDRLVMDIIVDLSDGSDIERRCDGPLGIWGRPVDGKRLDSKWSDALGATLGPDRARQVLAAVAGLPDVGAPAVAELMDKLVAPSNPRAP